MSATRKLGLVVGVSSGVLVALMLARRAWWPPEQRGSSKAAAEQDAEASTRIPSDQWLSIARRQLAGSTIDLKPPQQGDSVRALLLPLDDQRNHRISVFCRDWHVSLDEITH